MQKITALIATRGSERAQFVEHLVKHLLPNQTRQPDEVIIIDREPTKDNDHADRIAEGVERSTGDYIAFVEDDDYYVSTYFEEMGKMLKTKPELVGCSWTIYYHIMHGKIKYMSHAGRSSLFHTLIRTDIAKRIKWDRVGAIDMHLWNRYKDTRITSHPLAYGIKHGIGKCGGMGHDESFYIAVDNERRWLKSVIDEQTYNFYEELWNTKHSA